MLDSWWFQQTWLAFPDWLQDRKANLTKSALDFLVDPVWLEHNFQLHGKIVTLGKETAKAAFTQPTWKRVRAFRKVLKSYLDIHVHFCIVSCYMGILRSSLGSHSRNLAFVFQKYQLSWSSNRNKGETASLPGRVFRVTPAGVLTFLAPTCLPPQPCEKECYLGRTWTKNNETWFQHFHAIFTRKCFHWEHTGLRTCVTLLLRTEHFFIRWPQEPFYLQLDGGKKEMELQWKGNYTSLSHTFLLSYIIVYKLSAETYKSVPNCWFKVCSQLRICWNVQNKWGEKKKKKKQQGRKF